MPKPPSHPVIVVPGITATALRDEYPLPTESVWSVLRKDYARVALHPDNLRYEAREPARLAADQLFGVAYEEFIEELRYNLRQREDEPVPVFPFAYDWRHPLEVIERHLEAFVEEVIERTKLLKHYHNSGYGDDPKVNVVGHSMGGLVIAGYLERAGNKARVAKVATLATPFRGSFEAVVQLATGTSNLSGAAPSSRERETARVTPALYHLIPNFRRGLEVAPGLPKSLFNVDIWQPSIVSTLSEYIRLKGLPPKDPKAPKRLDRAKQLFASLLAAARAHRKRVDSLKLSQAGLDAKDWLCVVGVDAETRVKLEVIRQGRYPDFRIAGKHRVNQWDDADKDRSLTGDGTVPFAGGVPNFLPLETLVCVTPGDFGYWEVSDKALMKVAGFHGIMPNMNMLHRLVVRHFTGRSDRRQNTWGRPAPSVQDKDWQPPLRLRNKG